MSETELSVLLDIFLRRQKINTTTTNKKT